MAGEKIIKLCGQSKTAVELVNNDTLTGSGQAVYKICPTYTHVGIMTGDVTNLMVYTATQACEIVDVLVSVRVVGQDADDVCSTQVVVKKNGTTVCSTEAKVTTTSNNISGAKTLRVGGGAGTGLQQPVLKTDGTEDLAIGDYLTVDLDGTVTGDGTYGTDIITTVVLAHTSVAFTTTVTNA